MTASPETQAQVLARQDWALAYQLGHVLTALSKNAYNLPAYGHFADYLQEVLDLSSSTARRWVFSASPGGPRTTWSGPVPMNGGRRDAGWSSPCPTGPEQPELPWRALPSPDSRLWVEF
ncbi:MAG: hypothetical protein AMXMBFR33_59180 [Candidatus Xenobia bacterium]